jgi:pimeloyl-ACP methyl ester carboxylesterase
VGKPAVPPAAGVTIRTADGVRLVADHWDSGRRTLAGVVAHGFTGSARNPDVQRICQGLAAEGFDLLAVDFRGHGRSDGFTTAGGDEVYDIAAAVAWLRDRGYVTVATLGWSMGGTAVLRHAGLGGDTDVVVSVSAPGTWFERGTRPMRLVHWMFEKRLGRAATRLWRRTRIAPEPWSVVPEPPADVVGAIAPRPLLIVHGERDHYFPLRHVEALAAAAPTAQVWIEPGMRHAELATTPDLIARIAAWVRSAVFCDDDRRD